MSNAQNPVAIATAGADELMGAIMRLDPKLVSKFQINQATREQALQEAARMSPEHAPLINKVMLPLMKAQSTVANAAKSAAAVRRVRDSADLLETATHIIPISSDAVATATTHTYEVSTPFNGQPWRYLDIAGVCSQTVGVRLSSFKLTSIDHVVTDNVSYSVSQNDKGIDLALLSISNFLAANNPRHRWRPWGLKRSGVIRPDGKITAAISNRSGASASWFVALMVQASPCGEDSLYDDNKGGVYKRTAPQSRAFLQKLIRFSLYG